MSCLFDAVNLQYALGMMEGWNDGIPICSPRPREGEVGQLLVVGRKVSCLKDFPALDGKDFLLQ